MAYFPDDPLLDIELLANKLQADSNRRMREKLKARPFSAVPSAYTATGDVISFPTETDSSLDPPPWFKLIRSSISPDAKGSFFLNLNQEMCAFTQWLKPTTDEVEMRDRLLGVLGKAVRRVNRAAQVVIFGSVYTGLCLPDGDLDLAVTGLSITHMSRHEKKTVMKRLAKILIDDGTASNVEVVDTARVPIVKFITKANLVSIDIAFGLDKNPRRTSEWVKSQLVKFPALKPLVLFLKVYLMLRSFNEPFYGGIGSYLLVVLVTAFIKNHASFRNRTVYSACNLGHLLFDFFKFYGEELDEERVGIASNGSLQPNRHGSRGLLSCESPDDPYLDLGQPAFEYPHIKNCFRNTYFAMCAGNVSLASPELLGSDYSWAERKTCEVVLDESESESSTEEEDEVIPVNPRLLKNVRGRPRKFVVAPDSTSSSSSEETSPVASKRPRLSSWGGQQWSSETSD
jgi:DNA polymerase sigma